MIELLDERMDGQTENRKDVEGKNVGYGKINKICLNISEGELTQRRQPYRIKVLPVPGDLPYSAPRYRCV